MRSPVSVVAEFPFTEVNRLDIHAFELQRHPLSMDVIRLKVISNKNSIKYGLGPGNPVYVRWNAKPAGDRFFGYVHAVRPYVDGLERWVEILCLGAFMPMLTPYTQTYPNMGAHNAAAEVMDAHRLHLNAYPHPEVSTFEQNDQSDWEFVTTLARRIGYVTITTGITMFFQPLEYYWGNSLRSQRRAATFSRAVSPESNLLSFEKDEAGAQAEYQYNISPSLGFAEFARTGAVQGLKTDLMLRDMFPSRAHAVMAAPRRILPMDVFDIVHDDERLTWTVMEVKYVYDGTQFLAYIEFGGNEQWVAPVASDNLVDVPTVLVNQERQTLPAPILLNHRAIYVGSTAGTDTPHRWAARVVTPPNVEAV
jgi:hypothetical protein